MESRKLIKLGNSSFAVALPKDWVTKSGLKKGDTIFIVPNSNGELMVSPTYQNKRNDKIKYLDFSKTEPKDITRELFMNYVQDNSGMHITGMKDKDKKTIVKKVLPNMAGMEVMELNRDEILLKDFFNFEGVKIENFLRRIDNTIRSIFEDLEIAINKSQLSNKQYQEIIDADNEVNKFYFLITKILFKGLNNPAILNTLKTDSLELFNWWWLAFNIEHIGDELKRMAKLLKEKEFEKNKREEIKALFLRIKESYTLSLNSFYKKDRDSIAKVLIDRESMHLGDILSRDCDSSVAKIAENLKNAQVDIFQINKIMLYQL